jgi:putative nucleotidyltransferase with HDIG domain
LRCVDIGKSKSKSKSESTLLMQAENSQLVEVDRLRVGMFIQLELGWMDHPFPLNSFRISTQDQIQTIQTLGIATVRWFQGRSDPDAAPVPPPMDASSPGGVLAETAAQVEEHRREHVRELESENARLLACERRFAEATRQYRRTIELLPHNPMGARDSGEALVGDCVEQLLANGESAIRLLSESVGERGGQHPVNVLVLSLLLAQSLGLGRDALMQVGLAGLLHDIGKLEMPDRLRNADEGFSTSEYRAYQEHVALGVALAERMGLHADAVAAIAQHHEMADSSGFPARLSAAAMGTGGKVVALVNRYDNLCNPARIGLALTPHESLSGIFAQMKPRFDPVVLAAFIRMMGVYPPGSVVQLGNEQRYGLVVSVNSARPLRPRVLIFDPSVDAREAPIIDLQAMPGLAITRSVKPSQIPREASDYLSPRKRICYFFESAVEPLFGAELP